MRFRVVEVVSTPNPNAVKFVLDRAVAEKPVSFLSATVPQVGEEVKTGASGDPVVVSGLVARLFAIPGVSSLLFLNDFVTVNKRPEAKWPGLKRAVKKVLAEG
jgi:hypothetical protein